LQTQFHQPFLTIAIDLGDIACSMGNNLEDSSQQGFEEEL